MGFVTWLSEGLQYWTVYYQITSETGWAATQQVYMSFAQQELYDRMTAWVKKGK